ncbi:MAG: hypothetical protein C0631_02840 [Sedimenticola sp.]|nr:MAG: hypothetical protein C0631_02840 [Sedimenticola sp.]
MERSGTRNSPTRFACKAVRDALNKYPKHKPQFDFDKYMCVWHITHRLDRSLLSTLANSDETIFSSLIFGNPFFLRDNISGQCYIRVKLGILK